jgi:dUTPase
MSLDLGPRQYEPIWRKLKALPAKQAATQGVSVTAPRALHKRILKAVVKEKWLDIGYKMEIEPKHAIMYHSRSGSILTFFLRQYNSNNMGCPFTEDDF